MVSEEVNILKPSVLKNSSSNSKSIHFNLVPTFQRKIHLQEQQLIWDSKTVPSPNTQFRQLGSISTVNKNELCTRCVILSYISTQVCYQGVYSTRNGKRKSRGVSYVRISEYREQKLKKFKKIQKKFVRFPNVRLYTM